MLVNRGCCIVAWVRGDPKGVKVKKIGEHQRFWCATETEKRMRFTMEM